MTSQREVEAMSTDEVKTGIFTHDGFLTLRNPETDGHQVFHIKSQADDAKFAAGRRILTLVEGKGRGERTSFAFIGDRRIFLWKRFSGDKPWTTYVSMMEDPRAWSARITYHFEARCRACGRELTDPESIRLGIGPKCRGTR
jgi:hypothetical protein